jgi:GNAT superfamily N-acetyltransferase
MTPIRARDARDAERQLALRIALSEPESDPYSAGKAFQMTEAFLQRCGGKVGGLHLAEASGCVLSACAVLDLPGGVGLLVLPAAAPERCREGLGELLDLASRSARQRGRRFVQVMLEPALVGLFEPALRQAGFDRLAILHYMQRSAYDPVAIRPVEGVNWLTLADTDEAAFAAVIQRTYIDSQDCPALTGVRSMRDVLDSHRGAGPFDPLGWYLLEYEGQRAGVLITARTTVHANLDVVYVGLVPEARAKGLGRLCMHRAIQRARDLALAGVTLAVDAANRPACRLYANMGFSVYARKDVWFQVFRRADAEGMFQLPAR